MAFDGVCNCCRVRPATVCCRTELKRWRRRSAEFGSDEAVLHPAIGRRCTVKGHAGVGTIRSFGAHAASGKKVVGVAFDSPVGGHDGKVDGNRSPRVHEQLCAIRNGCGRARIPVPRVARCTAVAPVARADHGACVKQPRVCPIVRVCDGAHVSDGHMCDQCGLCAGISGAAASVASSQR